jgi:hypothetical protein
MAAPAGRSRDGLGYAVSSWPSSSLSNSRSERPGRADEPGRAAQSAATVFAGCLAPGAEERGSRC